MCVENVKDMDRYGVLTAKEKVSASCVPGRRKSPVQDVMAQDNTNHIPVIISALKKNSFPSNAASLYQKNTFPRLKATSATTA